MNQENFDYLSRQIKFSGFGEGHTENLKAKIESGEKDFTLTHSQDFGKDQVAAALQFHRPDNSDRYYFNHYSLVLKADRSPDPIKQVFYLNPKQDNVTLKEGYNLLSGRAVNKLITPKEGEKYKAWLQLDLKTMDANGQFKVKQFHPNYGFDLEANVHKYPIHELKTIEGTQRLLESLERGNRQQVTVGHGNYAGKVFIEAAPQFKTLNLYDDSQKLVILPAEKAAIANGQPKQATSTENKTKAETLGVQQEKTVRASEERNHSATQDKKQKNAPEQKPVTTKQPRQKLH